MLMNIGSLAVLRSQDFDTSPLVEFSYAGLVAHNDPTR